MLSLFFLFFFLLRDLDFLHFGVCMCVCLVSFFFLLFCFVLQIVERIFHRLSSPQSTINARQLLFFPLMNYPIDFGKLVIYFVNSITTTGTNTSTITATVTATVTATATASTIALVSTFVPALTKSTTENASCTFGNDNCF